MSAKQKSVPQKGTFASNLVEYLEMFVFAVVFVIVVMTFGFRLCQVDGPSMNQTLSHGERLLISDLFYTPKAGDIIVFHQSGSDVDYYNKPIVKRVIATEGQYVKIDYAARAVYVSDDDVFEQDEILNESAYAYYDTGVFKETLYGTQSAVFYVPEGRLFVMGDNRNNSADSRNQHIGMITEDCVLGKVLLRIAPFTKF